VIDVGIKDLCAKTAVTPRTVHFYIQQGLLPPPEGAGRGARYTEAHLARLQLIRRLQKEHLPLNEIRRRLEALSDEQVVQALAGGTPSPAGTKQSALDYIQSVTARAGTRRRASTHTPRPTLDAVASLTPEGATRSSTQHSHWDRIVLNDDVELHIRRPLSRDRNRFVEKLLAFARQMTKEEQS
jgi:DNA-binding transcriptional MerR regulator